MRICSSGGLRNPMSRRSVTECGVMNSLEDCLDTSLSKAAWPLRAEKGGNRRSTYDQSHSSAQTIENPGKGRRPDSGRGSASLAMGITGAHLQELLGGWWRGGLEICIGSLPFPSPALCPALLFQTIPGPSAIKFLPWRQLIEDWFPWNHEPNETFFSFKS